MLVLDGLLVRELDVEGLRCCELLGPGDVLRPWDEDDETGSIECHATWRVIEPTRLALLDAGFARRACRWPTADGGAPAAHLEAEPRARACCLAATQARRAEVRLRALFWHLADRWGRVTPDGVILPLPLTHSVIAQLTGLRRPSVSISLGELERAGEIVRLSKDSWLIARSATLAKRPERPFTDQSPRRPVTRRRAHVDRCVSERTACQAAGRRSGA